MFTCGWSIGDIVFIIYKDVPPESELSLALAGSHRWRRVCVVLSFTRQTDIIKMSHSVFTFMLWFAEPRWSRANFLHSSSLLSSGSKPEPSCIIHGVFVFSPKHFGAVPHLQRDSKSGAVQRRVGDLPRRSPPPPHPPNTHCWLKMTFLGHPDKAILPAAQTGSLKRFFYSGLFTLSWESGILLWSAASAVARQEKRL